MKNFNMVAQSKNENSDEPGCRSSFLFHRYYFDVIQAEEHGVYVFSDAERLCLYHYIMEYAFHGIVPGLMRGAMLSAWSMLFPRLQKEREDGLTRKTKRA